MSVVKSFWGKSREGLDLYKYVVTDGTADSLEITLTNLGANLMSLMAPDKSGVKADVVLGLDTIDEYYGNSNYFGCTVGPSANRIAGASFDIEGIHYTLKANDHVVNNLHSDHDLGYHKRVWDVRELDNGIEFSLEDSDGSMGFPGNKKVKVTYTVVGRALRIVYHAESDRTTLINMTNHSYFNMKGHDQGIIEDHNLVMSCSKFTPLGEGSIVTGEIADVAGTPMDFTQIRTIGRDIRADHPQIKAGTGYDHNFCIDGWDGSLREFAMVSSPDGSRVMHVSTTLPGVQLYTGNYAGGTGKGGCRYQSRSGVCFETQFYPDSVHHDNFPSALCGPGRDYDSVTEFRFE